MNRRRKDKILADMTVLDIIDEYPETESIFRSYDEQVGECICCQRLFHTVQQVAESYKLDLVDFLKKLNSAVAN